MILRRFMQHLKEQNWFAVGLDVIVVIVGIFLGMQVTEWYEDREKRDTEEAYLNRLYNDISRDINSLDTALSTQLRRLEYATIVYLAVSDEDVVKKDPTGFVSAIHYAGYTFTPGFYTDTYEELKSAGDLSLITNNKIREQLADYHALIKTSAQWNYLREFVQTEYLQKSYGLLTHEQKIDLSNFKQGFSVSLDEALIVRSRLIDNKDFIEFLSMTNFGNLMARNMRRQAITGCTLHTLLATATKKPQLDDQCEKIGSTKVR